MTVQSIRNAMMLALVGVMLQSCYKDNGEDLYGLDGQCAEPATQTYYFSEDVQPVFATNCAVSGCHAAGNGGGRVELVGHEKVASAIDNNDLRRRIAEGSMPPSGDLAPCDKQAILSWIDQNYPNN